MMRILQDPPKDVGGEKKVRPSQYALGHSERELERLTRQAHAFEPFTRHLLQLAGIDSGMRVLDVGCGSGDVAFLVADLVGSKGEVIGADRAASAVEWASTRARSQGISNVVFLEGDPAEMQFDRPFDAIVGRLVLMYCPDPINAVRKLIRHLRVGGLMVFQELDCENCRSVPPTPTYDHAASWIKKSLAASGARLQLGLELFGMFLAAGLPEPSLRMDALIGGGPDCAAFQLIADIVETLLPEIEKQRITTAAEVEISTLAHRMREEVVNSNGVVLSPGLIGAWSRKSAPLVANPRSTKVGNRL
jgi:SAM-dependent methyltransferase